MTAMQTIGVSAITRKLKQQLAETGIILETGTDFRFFKRVIASLPNKNQLGPRFDPDNKTFDPNGAFWIIGRDPDGRVVHTQALCLENLRGMSLARYLEDEFTTFFPYTPDPKRTKYFAGPSSHVIRGTTCYHGELWLLGGNNRFRGMGLAAPLVRLAILTAMEIWDPDYIFGFVRVEVITKGLAARAGFLHMEPDSLIWSKQGEQQVNKAWMTWLGREDLIHLLNMTAMDMELPMVERTLRFGLQQVA
ncbi:MAG TPA: hypothetical protein ENK63_00410 [Rhodobacterales bacterium]|nr:hypothetical protein [Rhodobacterales bacterium]